MFLVGRRFGDLGLPPPLPPQRGYWALPARGNKCLAVRKHSAVFGVEEAVGAKLNLELFTRFEFFDFFEIDDHSESREILQPEST